jgi:hypothetical protein
MQATTKPAALPPEPATAPSNPAIASNIVIGIGQFRYEPSGRFVALLSLTVRTGFARDACSGIERSLILRLAYKPQNAIAASMVITSIGPIVFPFH